MNVELLFRVAAIGLLMAVASTVLKSAGREDIAMVCNIGGLVLALALILGGVSDLFTSIKALFPLYG
jgi:stage III sporulation protein AC